MNMAELAEVELEDRTIALDPGDARPGCGP